MILRIKQKILYWIRKGSSLTWPNLLFSFSDMVFHLSAHFFWKSANTTTSSGNLRLYSSRQVCKMTIVGVKPLDASNQWGYILVIPITCRNEIISEKYLNEECVRGHYPLRSVVVQGGVPGNPSGRAASRHSGKYSWYCIFVKKIVTSVTSKTQSLKYV